MQLEQFIAVVRDHRVILSVNPLDFFESMLGAVVVKCLGYHVFKSVAHVVYQIEYVLNHRNYGVWTLFLGISN